MISCVTPPRTVLVANRVTQARVIAFDFATAAISVVDVVTDVLVIGEYARAGRRARPFLALSLGIFGLSSAVFAALFVGVFLDDRVDLGDRLQRRNGCGPGQTLLFQARVVAMTRSVCSNRARCAGGALAGLAFVPRSIARRLAPRHASSAKAAC